MDIDCSERGFIAQSATPEDLMKKLFILLGIVFLVVVLLAVAGLLFKGQIIEYVLVKGAKKAMGVEVTVGEISFDKTKKVLEIDDFKVYNPQGFPEGVMMDMPEVIAEIDTAALRKKKVHLSRLEVNLKELVVIKDKDGKLNVDALSLEGVSDNGEEGKGQKTDDSSMLQIDLLLLSIGKVVSKDYTKGEKPKIDVYDVNVEKKEFHDIPGEDELVAIIVSQSLMPTAIKGAMILGVTAATGGIGFIPMMFTFKMVDKDTAQGKFKAQLEDVYNITVGLLQKEGKITKEDKQQGLLEGKVKGADVTININQDGAKKVKVTVKAREMMMAKPDLAKSILHQISEAIQLKEK